MKQLIVNADDFGYTPGVNRAIVAAHRTGIVTSTSLLANGAAFAEAVEQWRSSPGLDVGCHLNLVEGRPLSPPERIPHLVRSGGGFHHWKELGWRLAAGRVPMAEMEQEFSAQIEKIQAAGIHPSHLDTHQHIHMHPGVAGAVARMGRQHGIGWARRLDENCAPPLREGALRRRVLAAAMSLLSISLRRQMGRLGIKTADAFTGLVLTGRLTLTALRATLAGLPEGITELMCHPGYCDGALSAAPTMLKQQREMELATVTDASWGEWLRERGIVLTSFRKLSSAS